MAFSPLDVDKAIVKEFKVPADAELDKPEKLDYCHAQVHEIKKYLWRTRADLTISTLQAQSDDKQVAAESQRKIDEYKAQIKQIVTSIKVFNTLIQELEK